MHTEAPRGSSKLSYRGSHAEMNFPATFEEGGGGASEMDFPEIPEGGWVSKSTTRTEPKNDNGIFVMQKKNWWQNVWVAICLG